ncbi:MAG: caspase family protein, partial [Desulfobulbaceae bacterium]|nr:caspase family protein [Desulfobulbaceae bacterium]
MMMNPLFEILRFLFITLLVFLPSVLQAGIRNVPITDKQGTEQILYDESHALLIGASSYYAGWPVLPNVKNDIDKVEQALLQHGFIVTRVIDPDGKQLPAVIDKFVQDHGMAEANRLLIYFAGHGHTVKKKYGEVMGYLVPVDAPNPQVDMKGFLSKSMPIQAIELVAKRIDSKHALFLFDSCFSGSIFSLSRAIPKSISHKTSLPVRQFITSGGAEEQVPDLSIFMRQFVAALNGEGDSDGDGYLTGSELGIFLTDSVINYSKDMQHPQYGKIRNRHLDKGDFVFVLPMKNPQEVKKTIAISLATIEEKDTELMFWDTIKNSSNPNDFKAYIKQFPNGRFVALARIRSGPLPTPIEVLPGQRLTPKKIPVVQAPAPPARVAKKDPELVRQENEKKKQEEIHRLLQQAQSHIDAYRLTTPKNRNAIFIIRKILKLSPGNQPAIQKLKEITDTYVELGQQAMESHNLNKAKLRYRHGLNIAKEFNLPEQNLSSLNLEIVEYLAKKEAKAQKAETAAREKKKKQQKLAKKKQKEKELAEKERKKKKLIVK